MKKNGVWIVIIIALVFLIVYLVLKGFMPVREYKYAVILGEIEGREILSWDFSDSPALQALYDRGFYLEATLNYAMVNPTNFLDVEFLDCYDVPSFYKGEFPDDVDIAGKVFVVVRDNRGSFSRKSGIVLLERFKRELEVICSFIGYYTIDEDMNTDIVAKFYSKEGIPLGYFYQGEYYLWEE